MTPFLSRWTGRTLSVPALSHSPKGCVRSQKEHRDDGDDGPDDDGPEAIAVRVLGGVLEPVVVDIHSSPSIVDRRSPCTGCDIGHNRIRCLAQVRLEVTLTLLRGT